MDEAERKNIIESIQALIDIGEPCAKEDPARYSFAFNINDPLLFAQDVGAWAERCLDGQEAEFFKFVIRRCADVLQKRRGPRLNKELDKLVAENEGKSTRRAARGSMRESDTVSADPYDTSRQRYKRAKKVRKPN